jgi:putative hydrolase of the HAD superfamily
VALLPRDIAAVVFDYGNTLASFGQEQIRTAYARFRNALTALYGPCDEQKLKSIRDRQIVAPYQNGYRENVVEEIIDELVRELYHITPDAAAVMQLSETRHHVFQEVVEVPGEVKTLLKELSQRYRLGLLSNFPCGRTVRDSLENNEVLSLFEVVVISGEVGYVKPHPLPFETVLQELELKAGQCCFVGDNWLADIQGAKRMGMQAVLTTEYVPYEKCTPEQGDLDPDARIGRLSELGALLK